MQFNKCVSLSTDLFQAFVKYRFVSYADIHPMACLRYIIFCFVGMTFPHGKTQTGINVK